MTWQQVLLILLILVVATVAYYLGYALAFVYLFLCEARRSGNRGRIARRLFGSIAAYVDEVRGEIDPERLRRIDQKMLRNTPAMVALTIAVLVVLGWLASRAFRYLI